MKSILDRCYWPMCSFGMVQWLLLKLALYLVCLLVLVFLLFRILLSVNLNSVTWSSIYGKCIIITYSIIYVC